MNKLLIVTAVVVAAGIGGVGYANHTVTQKVQKEVDHQLEMFTKQTGVTTHYDDISASIFNSGVEFSGISFISSNDQPMATVERIEMSGYEPNKIAEHTEVAVEAFKFSEEFIAQLPQGSNNKLAKATYDLSSLMDYDEESGGIELAVNVNANDIADVQFDLGVTKATALMNASLKAAEMQQSSGQEISMQQQLQIQTLVMQAMNELELRSINLNINNEGQLKPVVEEALNKQGLTFEQMQQLVAQELQQIAVSEDLRKAMTEFSSGLNSFSISASLPEGQTMTQVNQQVMTLMGQPEELAKFINLKVKGE
ncbi:MAG: hypothetical protein ACTJH9_06450 [Pseudoalteromonas sp.]|uniref:hypothetical protein n=1 Tax=unclassified Pseudoalteromonas TaxID=194690 RepID=UPI003F9DD085